MPIARKRLDEIDEALDALSPEPDRIEAIRDRYRAQTHALGDIDAALASLTGEPVQAILDRARAKASAERASALAPTTHAPRDKAAVERPVRAPAQASSLTPADLDRALEVTTASGLSVDDLFGDEGSVMPEPPPERSENSSAEIAALLDDSLGDSLGDDSLMAPDFDDATRAELSEGLDAPIEIDTDPTSPFEIVDPLSAGPLSAGPSSARSGYPASHRPGSVRPPRASEFPPSAGPPAPWDEIAPTGPADAHITVIDDEVELLDADDLVVFDDEEGSAPDVTAEALGSQAPPEAEGAEGEKKGGFFKKLFGG
jgi:hypothetical protein